MNGINDWGGAPTPYEQMEQPEEFDQVDELIEDQVQDTGSVVNEALKRIEQAKLYESLLRHPLFAPGSARPEIMNAVQDEIRAFILERLETLVGLRHPAAKASPVSIGLSEEQLSALRVLADRMIQKNNESNRLANPQVMPLQAQESPTPRPAQPQQPIVQPLRPQGGPSYTQAAPAQPKPVQRRKAAPKPAAPAEEGQPGERKIRHRQGQAVSKTHRPLPMPDMNQTANIHAAEVSKTSMALQGAQGGLAQLLNIAVMDAQSKNRNVKED